MKYDNGIKKCPRCHEKYLISQKKCQFCGLVFDRLNYVSNKSARKEVIKLHRRNYIMTDEWPADASKKTALLLCAFLGFTGAHNFYLGRFYKGLTVLFGLICSMVLLLIPYKSLAYEIIWYISLLPAASVLILWVLDFIRIFLERYKIPVSIDEKLYSLKSEIIVDEKKDNGKNKEEKDEKTENIEKESKKINKNKKKKKIK